MLGFDARLRAKIATLEAEVKLLDVEAENQKERIDGLSAELGKRPATAVFKPKTWRQRLGMQLVGRTLYVRTYTLMDLARNFKPAGEGVAEHLARSNDFINDLPWNGGKANS